MKNTFKLSLAAVLVSTAMAANAGISIVDNEQGNFSIGGDVEFDFNFENIERHARDNSGAVDPNSSETSNQFNQSGRILLEFAGERYTESGHVFQVNVQPLMESSGNVALDDAWFAFGAQDGWNLRMGRFEAFDMFPVGQDTFLEYSGDTANDLYVDGAAYVYQMKEGRGRGSDGQLMFSQNFGNVYFEVSSMIGDRSVLFGENAFNGNVTYHGETVVNNKDSVLLRPVVAYQAGNFGIAAAMEANLVKNAVITEQSGVDISDRTGYGLTANYTTSDWNLIANFAYMDAVDEDNMTVGVNALYKGFGLGYIHASNEYENSKISGYAEGKAKVDTVYTSYEFADVLEVDDFSIYLGAYYTKVDDQTVAKNVFEENGDTGVRVRFKYFF
ncbi:carbohydrate porin [Vibrio sp. SCSIO 43140]|uniref:carbohydrate porin n=1 Tax=Vibrio sp. SCSIO 43140 TaxID=2819100 RepID=UPI002075BEE3|nr:carbohydrate porin [Vibrio sp. SCSIO 43140]USD62842.1 carbohydrate porin [Vibrio sp. SCSIO 43140]